MAREERKITDWVHTLYRQGPFSEFLWTFFFSFEVLDAHTDAAAVKLGDWDCGSVGHGEKNTKRE